MNNKTIIRRILYDVKNIIPKISQVSSATYITTEPWTVVTADNYPVLVFFAKKKLTTTAKKQNQKLSCSHLICGVSLFKSHNHPPYGWDLVLLIFEIVLRGLSEKGLFLRGWGRGIVNSPHPGGCGY